MPRRKPPPGPPAQTDLFPAVAPAETNATWQRIEDQAKRGSEALVNRRKLVKPKLKLQLGLFDESDSG